MIKSLPRKNLRQIWTRLRFPWAWNLMDLRVSWKLKYENGSSTLSSTVWSTILLLGNNVSTWVALKWNAFTESKRRNCCRPSSWLHQSMGKPSYGGNLQSHLITKQLRQLGFIDHLWQNLKGFLNNVFQQERVQIPASCLHFCKYGLPRLFPFAVLSSSSLHSLIPWRLSSDWSPLPSSMFLYFWSAGAFEGNCFYFHRLFKSLKFCNASWRTLFLIFEWFHLGSCHYCFKGSSSESYQGMHRFYDFSICT